MYIIYDSVIVFLSVVFELDGTVIFKRNKCKDFENMREFKNFSRFRVQNIIILFVIGLQSLFYCYLVLCKFSLKFPEGGGSEPSFVHGKVSKQVYLHRNSLINMNVYDILNSILTKFISVQISIKAYCGYRVTSI